MQSWLDAANSFAVQQSNAIWVWFNTLSREEWLIVMAVCCAGGFLFLKSWGSRGPC